MLVLGKVIPQEKSSPEAILCGENQEVKSDAVKK